MLAGRYLRAKRQHGGVALISVISVIAITLAVFVLIITMSVMNGFRETLLSRILGVNGHVYVDVRNLPGSEIQRLAALAREAPDVLHVARDHQRPRRSPPPTAWPPASSCAAFRAKTCKRCRSSPTASAAAAASRTSKASSRRRILVGDRLAASLGVSESMAISILSPQGAATPFGLTPRRKSFLIGGVFSVGMAEFDSALDLHADRAGADFVQPRRRRRRTQHNLESAQAAADKLGIAKAFWLL